MKWTFTLLTTLNIVHGNVIQICIFTYLWYHEIGLLKDIAYVFMCLIEFKLMTQFITRNHSESLKLLK